MERHFSYSELHALSVPHFDLLGLSKQKKSEASLLVKSNKRNVHALIHPYFVFNDKDAFSVEEIARASRDSLQGKFDLLTGNRHNPSIRYLPILTRLIQKSNVLVVGEEKENLLKTLQVFQQLGYRGSVIYYLTQESCPNPIQNGSWKMVHRNLRSLGVRNLLVGGQYSGFEDTAVDCNDNSKGLVYRLKKHTTFEVYDENPLYGCAAHFAYQMAHHGLNVSISQASLPQSRPLGQSNFVRS